MKTAYIDMIGGASGDMLLGALINVGLSIDDLRSELALMDIGGYTLRSEQVSRGALNCTLLHVDLDEEGQRRRGWDELSDTIESSRLPEEVRIKSIEVLDRLTDAESVVHGVDRHHLTPHELGTVDTLVDIVGVAFAAARTYADRRGIERSASASESQLSPLAHTSTKRRTSLGRFPTRAFEVCSNAP